MPKFAELHENLKFKTKLIIASSLPLLAKLTSLQMRANRTSSN